MRESIGIGQRLKEEPAAVAVAVVLALLNLFIAFGVEIKPEQQTAILTAVNTIIPVAGWLVRQRVTPVAKTKRLSGLILERRR